MDLNLCFPPQPLPFLTFPFKPCGKCSLSLPVPVCLCRPFPVQETHGRRNGSKVISLGQSDEDGSSQREIFEGKGHLVWTRPVTHCSPTLPLSLSAMPLGNPHRATNNNLMEKPASCPAVFHVFAQTLYSSLSPHCRERGNAISPVLQTALLSHQV